MTIHPSVFTWLLLAAAATLLGPARTPPALADRRPMSRRAAAVVVVSGVLVASSVVLGGRGLLVGAVAAAVVVVSGVLVASSVVLGGRGLLVGAVAAPVAVAIVRRLHDRAPPSRPSASLALTLDLVSIALRAGQPLDTALAHAADPGTGSGNVLLRVAGLLRLGADAEQAWQIADDDAVLARVAATARRSATSGTRLASAFERLATDLRDEIRASAQARGHRVGVLVAAPLGLCFLPAFVCLGIVPIIVGIAGGLLG